MFTILVCGGKDYTDHEQVFTKLNEACDNHKLWDGGYHHGDVNTANCRVIAGASTMVDAWAECWADAYNVHGQAYNLDAKHGVSASSVRNQTMIDERPDLVLCFGRDSNTEDVIGRAYKAKIPVQTFKQSAPVNF